jgi:hypothetical protein
MDIRKENYILFFNQFNYNIDLKSLIQKSFLNIKKMFLIFFMLYQKIWCSFNLLLNTIYQKILYSFKILSKVGNYFLKKLRFIFVLDKFSTDFVQ